MRQTVHRVVALAILAVGCSSGRGALTLENRSSWTIARASLSACGQTFEEKDLRPGGAITRSYKLNCEGHYDVVISFASGKTLESHEGYITPGVDFEGTFTVTDNEIKISHESAHVR